MITLLFSLIACSNNLSVNDKVQGDQGEQLLGDSNVFLEEPDISLDTDSSSSSDNNPDDTALVDSDTNYEGVLLSQDGATLSVLHFGANLPCSWTQAELNVGYYADSVPEPYNGAFLADYGTTGSCVTDVEYDVDLSAIDGLFQAGPHLYYAQNHQVVINLTTF